MKRFVIGSFVLLTAHPIQTPYAGVNDQYLNRLIEAQFEELTEQIGSALNYKVLTPSKPLEKTGFDIGFKLSNVIVDTDSIERPKAESIPILIAVPSLLLQKELSRSLDVGAFYSTISTANIKFFGGELRYSILQGNSLSPSLLLRGSVSQITGLQNIDLITKELELSVSQGFAEFRPYAGIGTIWIDHILDNTNYAENISQIKYFLGLNYTFGLISFAAETSQEGETSSTRASMGVRF